MKYFLLIILISLSTGIKAQFEDTPSAKPIIDTSNTATTSANTTDSTPLDTSRVVYTTGRHEDTITRAPGTTDAKATIQEPTDANNVSNDSEQSIATRTIW